jgi:hypothetical protein
MGSRFEPFTADIVGVVTLDSENRTTKTINYEQNKIDEIHYMRREIIRDIEFQAKWEHNTVKIYGSPT